MSDQAIREWLTNVNRSLHLFQVFRDRTKWISEAYKALEKREFSDYSIFDGQFGPETARLPIETTFTYATAVFTTSAVEAWLLHFFANSAIAFEHLSNTKLRGLRKALAQRLKNKTLEIDSTHLHDILDVLTGLQFSDLTTAGRFYDEIYGGDCFERAVSAKLFKDFRRAFGEIVGKRNSILHRGGETRKQEFVELSFNELHYVDKLAAEFVLGFSSWAGPTLLARTARMNP